MGNYTIFLTFENPRRGKQARILPKNVPKIRDLKSCSEQIFSENWHWVPLCQDVLMLLIVTVVDCINFDPLFSFQFGDYISHMQLQKESADVNV